MAVRDVRNSMSVEGGYCMARDKTNTGMVGICEKKAYRDCGGDCFWKDDKDWGFCMARDKTNQRMVGACAKKDCQGILGYSAAKPIQWKHLCIGAAKVWA
eukprot:g4326.t1